MGSLFSWFQNEPYALIKVIDACLFLNSNKTSRWHIKGGEWNWCLVFKIFDVQFTEDHIYVSIHSEGEEVNSLTYGILKYFYSNNQEFFLEVFMNSHFGKMRFIQWINQNTIVSMMFWRLLQKFKEIICKKVLYQSSCKLKTKLISAILY